jgi:FMN phosphatase YigB (HAD superfamily)
LKTKTVFFDLDGTLLPMDQDVFTTGYFRFLAQKLGPYGYEPKTLVRSIWAGTAAMAANDGSRTNEEAFWKRMEEIYGEKVLNHKVLFEEFYRDDFQCARQFCGFQPLAAEVVRSLRRRGISTVLATNPIFPSYATESRVRWAGLEPSDFDEITVFETSRFAKPNPVYYTDLMERRGLRPEEGGMVGNDVGGDMIPASSLGLSVFLVTDCLIEKDGTDRSVFPQGDFTALKEYLERLQ